MSSRPARIFLSCCSFSASVVRYRTVSSRSCFASSRWTASTSAASSNAGRRLKAVSAAASAAAFATCASVCRAVRAATSPRRVSRRAPLWSFSRVRRTSSSFRASSSAASFRPASSMLFATARWRSSAAAASVLSCCPAAISARRSAALSSLRAISFSSTAIRLSLPLICSVMLRISPFRRSTAMVSCCACIRISSASLSAALVWRSNRS